MAKRVLRYTEEEFINLLENIVNKVKTEQKRIDEIRTINKRNGNNNDRFKKLI